MRILGYLLLAIAKILSTAISLYMYVVIGAVIVSLVNADPVNPIVRFLRQATEPVLYRVRKMIPGFLWKTGFDFSPVVVLLLLFLIDMVLINLLYDAGKSFLATR